MPSSTPDRAPSRWAWAGTSTRPIPLSGIFWTAPPWTSISKSSASRVPRRPSATPATPSPPWWPLPPGLPPSSMRRASGLRPQRASPWGSTPPSTPPVCSPLPRPSLWQPSGAPPWPTRYRAAPAAWRRCWAWTGTPWPPAAALWLTWASARSPTTTAPARLSSPGTAARWRPPAPRLPSRGPAGACP